MFRSKSARRASRGERDRVQSDLDSLRIQVMQAKARNAQEIVNSRPYDVAASANKKLESEIETLLKEESRIREEIQHLKEEEEELLHDIKDSREMDYKANDKGLQCYHYDKEYERKFTEFEKLARTMKLQEEVLLSLRKQIEIDMKNTKPKAHRIPAYESKYTPIPQIARQDLFAEPRDLIGVPTIGEIKKVGSGKWSPAKTTGLSRATATATVA
uniref:Uncharacterized protein n=1 Tax=Timspurckia oligopyrenoides TaxID=708627 RepID=A0A7S0ZDS4_9RHOD|mmetsp:Transcript_13883/g.24890  ORF Transcript_13883/g.24890 Transcript_13883/m.24890 type:complete len:215 (+) Transcript_13883:115-759(+)|eukprot:CAMPEP_0182447106 /NCGR_PEP_ID=MMETSP1172-20130603/11435_1 /TAXON_ID=708627 /ORGANISM="Timspurckia oligopyrenoides, Strain CCMP3278" /LENGTH=214 /DNA_ID=CAMNT_0024643401 /DNA_START=60 /DNA_END=704 /DNA_ORIENTATION=-